MGGSTPPTPTPTPKPPVQQPLIPTGTSLFKLMNPELYVPYNKWIALVGGVVCGAAVLNVGRLIYEVRRCRLNTSA